MVINPDISVLLEQSLVAYAEVFLQPREDKWLGMCLNYPDVKNLRTFGVPGGQRRKSRLIAEDCYKVVTFELVPEKRSSCTGDYCSHVPVADVSSV